MNKSLRAIAFVLLLSINGFAQPLSFVKGVGTVQQRAHHQSKITAETSKKPSSAQFASWIGQALKTSTGDGWNLIRSDKDQLGYVHDRYQQTYQGYPIEQAIYISHTKGAKIESANGCYFPQVKANTLVAVTEAQALSTALSHVGAKEYNFAKTKDLFGNLKDLMPKGTLVILPQEVVKGQMKYVLAYKFDIYAARPLKRAYVYIDASTGAYVTELNRIHTNNQPGTAQTAYSGTQAIVTDKVSEGNYRLRESQVIGGGISTLNVQRGTNLSSAIDFTDTDNNWNNVNANEDEVATDAHWGAERTYDYFLQKHNRNSYDNQGAALISYVHYDNAYDNAFWSGSEMVYGDGSIFKPLTSLDVCGHELTHAVTEYSAGLIYQNESGALNESFSDIFGNTVEFFAKPATASWILGEDITNDQMGLRSMSDPKANYDPDTYKGENWVSDGSDYGGVHTNSGVQNHWYYLLVEGGSGTNDNGANYTVDGIGLDKAAAIAYRNLTVYLTPSSTYADAREGAIQSAIDLYGDCSNEVAQTANAWYAVGVGPEYSSALSFTADRTTSCASNFTIKFRNLSSAHTNFIWDFGDSTTSTELNPSHTYTAYGNYTVKLKGTSCTAQLDSLVKNDYIQAAADKPCIYTMPQSGSSTFTSCDGELYDNGGSDSNYHANSNGTIVIHPNNSDRVELTFSEFSYEQDYDYIRVYDGPDTNSPLIGAFTGNNLPNAGQKITSSGNYLTITESIDPYEERSGFKANWHCVSVTERPVADFYAEDTLTCSGNIQFHETSGNYPSEWYWDFGDGESGDGKNPVHQYAAPGKYTVQLRACNTIGCDTITKIEYINFDDTRLVCQESVMPTQGQVYSMACQGVLYDNGRDTNYSAYTNSSFTIQPASGDYIALSFSEFEFESGYDSVYVYDGPDSSSPLLGKYSGSNLPNNGAPIYSSGKSMTIRQYTDAYVEYLGFKANWSCESATTAPTADFSSPDTLTCTGNARFLDQSSNHPQTWTWIFGDGDSSTARNPIHNYRNPGKYDVTLIACNTIGCDTITKTQYIDFDTTLVACSEYEMPDVSYQTETATVCKGTLYDNGGKNGNYNGAYSTFIIDPEGPNDAVAYNFNFFQLHPDSYLRVFDGTPGSGTLLATYSSYNPPPSHTLYTKSAVLSIEMETWGGFSDVGFAMDWECITVADRPNAVISPSDTTICQGTVTLHDISTEAICSRLWTSGDGSYYAEKDPTIYYSYPGNYTVQLEVVNAKGRDTAYATVHYNPDAPNCPSSITVPFSGTDTVTVCHATIQDNGGYNNYAAYSNGTLVLNTDSGDYFTLDFAAFNFETGYDSIHVYDGPSTASRLIGKYTGNTLPNGGRITSSGKSLTIYQKSDGSVQYTGFEAELNCHPATEQPIANFTQNRTQTCSGLIRFSDSSSNHPNEWFWDFGDGTTSTDRDPVHQYVDSGIYTVSMRVCNGLGCDSITRLAWINYNPNANACSYNTMPSNYGEKTSTACEGRLADDGGIEGNYSNNTYSTFTIQQPNDKILKFVMKDYAIDYSDYVYVYDGHPSSGVLLAIYTGVGNNQFDTLYSKQSYITVLQSTNSVTTYSGFDAYWICAPLPKPTAEFYSPDTLSCDQSVRFYDSSSNDRIDSWHWYFGDAANGQSNSQNPVYDYPAEGNFTVKLVVCNASGCDSITKTNYIKYDQNRPECDFHNMCNETSSTKCSGLLFDSGGEFEEYDSYENCQFKIMPDSADYVKFNVSSYSFEYGLDQLRIYDGPDTSYPLIASYTGTSTNNTDTLISSSNVLLVTMVTDGSVEYSGFKARWECGFLSAPPVANFTVNDSIPCSGIVSFTDLSTNAVSRIWNFGDNTTSTEKNPSHQYASAGTYTVTLIACNSKGCDTITKQVTYTACVLSTVPTTGVIYVSGCNGRLLDNGGYGNYSANSDGTVVISSGNNSPIELTFAQFNIEQGYDYLYIYDGNNTSAPLIGTYTGNSLPNGGVISSSGSSITVRMTSDEIIQSTGFDLTWKCLVVPAPDAAFTVNNLTSCTGKFSFTDQSLGEPTSWLWKFGDGSISTQQHPQHTYSEAGIYTVSLTACNSGGCDTTSIDSIEYNPNAAACDPFVIAPTGTDTLRRCSGTLYDNGGTSNYSNNTNGTLVIKSPGSDRMTLTFSSFSFESGYDYLYIYDGASSTSPLIGRYSGNGLPNGGVINSTGGAITIRQTSDNGMNKAGFGLTYQCHLAPVTPKANFHADKTTVSIGEQVVFTDESTGDPDMWDWDFGGDALIVSGTGKGPYTVKYTTAGYKTVTLLVSNSAGSDTKTRTNYIHVLGTKPVAKFSANKVNALIDEPITYTDSSLNNPTTWTWDFGADAVPATANGKGPHTVRYGSTGAKTIRLIAGNTGGQDSILRVNYVTIQEALPTADFIVSKATAETNVSIDVTYTGTATATATWNWDFGGATVLSGSGKGPFTISYPSKGQKQISLTVTNSAGSDTRSKQVTITDPIPVARFSADKTTITKNESVVFTDSSTNSPTIWSWDFGAGANPATANTKGPHTVSYATTGTKTVKLTAGNADGSTTEIKTAYITVTALAPVSGFKADKTVMVDNETVTFTDTSANTPTGWSWNFGEGAVPATAATKGPHTIVYTKPGLKTISLTTTNAGGSSSLSKSNYVEVKALSSVVPLADFIIDTEEPKTNTNIQFTDKTERNPTSWTWDFGDGSNVSNLQNPVHTFSEASTYIVTLIARNSYGSDTVVKEYVVNDEVGIQGIAKYANVKIFPNPTAGKVSICDELLPEEGYRIDIQNVIGETVFSKHMQKSADCRTQLDLGHLQNGLYILNIRSEKALLTVKKLIISNEQ